MKDRLFEICKQETVKYNTTPTYKIIGCNVINPKELVDYDGEVLYKMRESSKTVSEQKYKNM